MADEDKRLPGAWHEFKVLSDELHPLIKATEAGQGETMRVVLDVPKEWAILSAWLNIKEKWHRAGRFDALPSIGDHERLLRRGVKSRLRWLLNEDCHGELFMLSGMAHMVQLKPVEKAKP